MVTKNSILNRDDNYVTFSFLAEKNDDHIYHRILTKKSSSPLNEIVKLKSPESGLVLNLSTRGPLADILFDKMSTKGLKNPSRKKN